MGIIIELGNFQGLQTMPLAKRLVDLAGNCSDNPNVVLPTEIWNELGELTNGDPNQIVPRVKSELERVYVDSHVLDWIYRNEIWFNTTNTASLSGSPSSIFYAQYGLVAAVRAILADRKPKIQSLEQSFSLFKQPPTPTFMQDEEEEIVPYTRHDVTAFDSSIKQTIKEPTTPPQYRQIQTNASLSPVTPGESKKDQDETTPGLSVEDSTTNQSDQQQPSLTPAKKENPEQRHRRLQLQFQEKKKKKKQENDVYQLLFALLQTYLNHLEKKAPQTGARLLVGGVEQETKKIPPIQNKKNEIEKLFTKLAGVADNPDDLQKMLVKYQQDFYAIDKELITTPRGLFTEKALVTRENINNCLKLKYLCIPALILSICAFFICLKSQFKSSKKEFTLRCHGAVFWEKTEEIFKNNPQIFQSPQLSH